VAFQNHLSETNYLMWRFEHMIGLWALVIVPALAFLTVWLRRKKEARLKQFAQPEKLRALLENGDNHAQRANIRLWFSAFILLVLALANLQLGTEEDRVSSKGSNVVIALDLSNSMLARDVAPDRLERSKRMLSTLAGKFSGDRVALIVFAGRAYVQMPFTTDYGAFEMHLRSVNTDVMPTQGTALSEAISIALAMPGAGGQNEKVLVLLSDGEDHDSKAIDLAKKAADQNLVIHTIGVGTPQGGPIPVKTGAGVAYKTDRNGEQIISKLHEENLRSIAAAGGGKYFNINNERQALREITKSIKWAAGSNGEERLYRRYKSYFQWFLFPAILLLMLELARPTIRPDFSGLFKITSKNPSKTFTILLGLGLLMSCQRPANELEVDALRLLNEGQTEAAKASFLNLVKTDSSDKIFYQLGTTYMMLDQYDSMALYYEKALANTHDASLKSKMLYNFGCAAYAQGNYPAAVDFFGKSLLQKPENYRAQYNLCMALEHIRHPEQQEQEKNSEDQQQENKQEKQDKNEQQKDKNQNKDKGNDPNQQDPKEQDKTSDSDTQKKDSQQPGKMSQQDIQRLFETLDRQEKAVQRKVLEKSSDKGGQPYIEKDW
jgi:tetratricopeptide (TPR) repeat protein